MSKDIETLPVPQTFLAPLILLKNKPLGLSVHFYTILPATLRVAQPAHREETRYPRGSRMPPYERRGGVTPTEQREAQKGACSKATPATRRGGPTATTGIERRAPRARQAPQTRSTALRHHCTVDNLRACFEALDGSK